MSDPQPGTSTPLTDMSVNKPPTATSDGGEDTGMIDQKGTERAPDGSSKLEDDESRNTGTDGENKQTEMQVDRDKREPTAEAKDEQLERELFPVNTEVKIDSGPKDEQFEREFPVKTEVKVDSGPKDKQFEREFLVKTKVKVDSGPKDKQFEREHPAKTEVKVDSEPKDELKFEREFPVKTEVKVDSGPKDKQFEREHPAKTEVKVDSGPKDKQFEREFLVKTKVKVDSGPKDKQFEREPPAKTEVKVDSEPKDELKFEREFPVKTEVKVDSGPKDKQFEREHPAKTEVKVDSGPKDELQFKREHPVKTEVKVEIEESKVTNTALVKKTNDEPDFGSDGGENIPSIEMIETPAGRSDDEPVVTRGSTERSTEGGRLEGEQTIQLTKPWPPLLPEFRSRSYSDASPRRTVSLPHPSAVRACRSYMVLPHMEGQEGVGRGKDKHYTTPLLHQSFSWMHLPHFKEGGESREDFSTVSVMALAEAKQKSGGDEAIQGDEGEDKSLKCTPSDLEDSEGSESSVKEEAINIWDREGGRTRSLSEPPTMDDDKEEEGRPRALSLESFDKAKQPPSKLQFQVTLDSLEERAEERKSSGTIAEEESPDRVDSSILMLAESTDMEAEIAHHVTTSLEELDSHDEVVTRWTRHEGKVGANPARRASITSEASTAEESPSLSTKHSRTASVQALVDEITQDVMGRTSTDSIMGASASTFSEIETDESRHVIDPANYWRGKVSPNRLSMRRTTLATASPLRESTNYATQIEKQAFSKISQWKEEFAHKLDDVLSKGYKDRKDEAKAKRRPKQINVPMNLSQEELKTMRNNMVLELKRKSDTGELASMLHTMDERGFVPTAPPPPRVTRVRSLHGRDMKDIQGNLIKELKRASLTESGDGDLIPSKFLERLRNLHAASLEESDAKRYTSSESVRIPSAVSPYKPPSDHSSPSSLGLNRAMMTKEKISELLQWHDQERERLLLEMEKISGYADTMSTTRVVFQGAELEKVFRSLQVIMDSIFKETIQRLRCSDSERSDSEVAESKDTTDAQENSAKSIDTKEPAKEKGKEKTSKAELDTSEVVVQLKEESSQQSRESPKPPRTKKKKSKKVMKDAEGGENLRMTSGLGRETKPDSKKVRTKIPRFTKIVRPMQAREGAKGFMLHPGDLESSDTGSSLSGKQKRSKVEKTLLDSDVVERGYSAEVEDTTETTDDVKITETPGDSDVKTPKVSDNGDDNEVLEPDGISDGTGEAKKSSSPRPVRPVYRSRKPVSPGHSSTSAGTASSSSISAEGKTGKELQSSSSSREGGSLTFSTTLASDEMTESDDEWSEIEFLGDDGDDSSVCSEIVEILDVQYEGVSNEEIQRPHKPEPMTYEEKDLRDKVKKLVMKLRNHRRVIQDLRHELKNVEQQREDLKNEVDYLKRQSTEKDGDSGWQRKEYGVLSETVENLRALLEEKKELLENKDKQIVRLLRCELEGHKVCNRQMLDLQEKLKEVVKENKVYRIENERLRKIHKVERKDTSTSVELDDTDSDENESLKQQKNLEIVTEKMDQLNQNMQEKMELEEALKMKEKEIAALVSSDETRFSDIKHRLVQVEMERDVLKEKVSNLQSAKQEMMLDIERLLKRRNTEAATLQMASQIAEATRKKVGEELKDIEEDSTQNEQVNVEQKQGEALNIKFMEIKVADLQSKLEEKIILEDELQAKEDELVSLRAQEEKNNQFVNKLLKQRDNDAEILLKWKQKLEGLSSDLREKENMVTELKAKEEELASLKDDQDRKADIVKEILQRRETDAQAIDEASVQIEELEKALREKAQSGAELRIKYEELVAIREDAEKKNSTLKNGISNLQKERDALKEEITKQEALYKDNVTRLQQLVQRRGTEVEELSSEKQKQSVEFLGKIGILSEEKKKLTEKVDNLEESLETVQQELKSKLSVESELKGRACQLEKLVKEKDIEVGHAKESETSLREKMEELEKRNRKLEQQKVEQEEEASKSKASTNKLIEAQEKDISELNTSLVVLEGLVQKLSLENNSLKQSLEENLQLKQMIATMRSEFQNEMGKMADVAQADYHQMELALREATKRHNETSERLEEANRTMDEVGEMASEKIKRKDAELSAVKCHVADLKEQNANLKAILSNKDEIQEAVMLIKISDLQSKLSKRDMEIMELRKGAQEHPIAAETLKKVTEKQFQQFRTEKSKAGYGDMEFKSIMEHTGDRYRTIQKRIQQWREETEIHQRELDELLKSSTPCNIAGAEIPSVKHELQASTRIREDLAQLKATVEELAQTQSDSSRHSSAPDLTAMKLELKEREVERLKQFNAHMLEMKDRSHDEIIEEKNRLIKELTTARDEALRKAREFDLESIQRNLKDAVKFEIIQQSDKLKAIIQDMMTEQKLDEGAMSTMKESIRMNEACMKRLEETTVKTLSSVNTELGELKEYTFEMADVIEKDVFTSQEKLADKVKFSTEDLTKVFHEEISGLKELVSDNFRDYESLTTEALQSQVSLGLARWNDLQAFLDRENRRNSIEVEDARRDVVMAAEAVANTALELRAVKNTILSEVMNERERDGRVGRDAEEEATQDGHQSATQTLDAALLLRAMEHDFKNKARIYGANLLQKDQRLQGMSRNLGRTTTLPGFQATQQQAPEFELSRTLGTPTAASTMLPNQQNLSLSEAADRTNQELTRLRQTIQNQSHTTSAELQSMRSGVAGQKRLEEQIEDLRGRYQYLPSRDFDRTAIRDRIRARVATRAAGIDLDGPMAPSSTQTSSNATPVLRREAWGEAQIPSRESPRPARS